MAKFREKGRQEIENYLEQATDESAFVGELIKKTFEEMHCLLVIVCQSEILIICY